ncbi:MAG: hypothetical protein R2741_09800 [Methanolobus sp.]
MSGSESKGDVVSNESDETTEQEETIEQEKTMMSIVSVEDEQTSPVEGSAETESMTTPVLKACYHVWHFS